MALRARIRGQWRSVSPAMARRFRARGIMVVDESNLVASPVLEPDVPSADEVVLDLPGIKSAEVAAKLEAKEAVVSNWVDLTDDELERLTKPES